MKKVKYLLSLILVLAFVISLTSCYVISGQTMKTIKGTYKLTKYTYTPSHERKEGYTERTHDYVNDAEYKYEDYLVITGTDKGYYVHKDASGESYIKEVTLSYEYSKDNPSKIEYIVFNDSITVNDDDCETNRLGVSKKILNYAKSAFDFTQLITKKPMRSEALSIKWEKVDNATDLSFVNKQISDTKFYKYSAFARRGIYELTAMRNVESSEYLVVPYQYYYIVVDTADGVNTAKVYYATKEAPTEQITRTLSYSAKDDFSTMTIDGKVWSLEPQWSSYYLCIDEGIENQYRLVNSDISDASINSLIANRIPSTTN